MRAWLLEIAALDDTDTARTLRFSDAPYQSAYAYQTRLTQPALLTVRAAGSVVSSEKSSAGSAVLANADGALNYLADWAIDGRDAKLKLADGASVTTVLTGIAQSLSYDGNDVTIKLRDPFEQLDTPHPYTVYAGTNSLPNGVEGVSTDIKGKLKPRVYGSVVNATPELVNTAKLVYQVHDGATVTISAVRDRGVPLTDAGEQADLATLLAASVSAGSYKRYLGYLKLGAQPSGALTVDAARSVTGAGSVVAQLLSERGMSLRSGDAAALDAVGAVGLYLSDAVTTAELLTRVSMSLGGWWTFVDAGTVTMQLLAAPASPALTLREWQISDLRRRATGAGDNGIPYWRVAVNADPMETVQTDLPSTAAPSIIARAAAKYRTAPAPSSSTQTRHPLAGELSIDSVLRSVSDAQAVADRLLALLSVRRDALEIDCHLGDLALDSLSIGTVLRIITSRVGYSAGRNLIVLGYRVDARDGSATLYCWG